MRAPLLTLAALVLAALGARADDAALTGTYRLAGREGARALSGTVVIRADGTLTGPLGSLGAVTLAGAADGASWTFCPAVGGGVSGGIAGALAFDEAPADAPAAPAFTLKLEPGSAAGKLTGEVVGADGRRKMTVDLTRRKRALIAHAIGYEQSHDDVFRVYAKQIKTYYGALGCESDVMPTDSWTAVLDALRAAGESGATYTRVVLIGHGGWDGPIFHAQISPWYGANRWSELVEAFTAGTAPEAKVLVSACHAAGSDRWEQARGDTRDGKSWVDQVARATGRTVFGPAGYTSTTFALKQARALEGAGPAAQESRLADATGVRVVRGYVLVAKRTTWEELDRARAEAAAAASTP